MLTKKQQRKLDEMTDNYVTGMLRYTNADYMAVVVWSRRYRIRMAVVLQKQGKH